MLTILLVIAVICLAVKGLFEGIAGVLLSALGGALFLIVLAGFYVLTKGDIDSRQDMKRKYQENIADYQMEREYRFNEEYYEVISEYEYARLEYDCLGRLFDMSGMLVLLEKGDVIRFFQKNAIKKGDAVEFAAFLERKCERTIETVSLGK